MCSPEPVFAYFSPETFLPLTSVIASAVGVFLLFGSNVLRVVRRAFRGLSLRGRRAGTIPRPHFQPREQAIESPETAEQHTREEAILP
jgi:hypothetical protein